MHTPERVIGSSDQRPAETDVRRLRNERLDS
jgi:hypothetical protein